MTRMISVGYIGVMTNRFGQDQEKEVSSPPSGQEQGTKSSADTSFNTSSNTSSPLNSAQSQDFSTSQTPDSSPLSPPVSQQSTDRLEEQPPSPPLADYTTGSSRGWLKLLFFFLILASGGGAAFFLINFLSTPKRVKEKVLLIQPAYEEYVQSVDKIAEDLKEEVEGDSESIRRAVEKGKGLLKEAESKKRALSSLLDSSNPKQLDFYLAKIRQYITKSEELIKLERESVRMGDAWIDPVKRYEDLTVRVSGISNYLYTDPNRYLEELDKIIQEEKEIIKVLKSFTSPNSNVNRMNQALVKSIEDEVRFLEEMRQAVEERSVAKISAAQQRYASNTQTSSKEIRRLLDVIKEEVNSIEEELKRLDSQVRDEYQGLRTRYRF